MCTLVMLYVCMFTCLPICLNVFSCVKVENVPYLLDSMTTCVYILKSLLLTWLEAGEQLYLQFHFYPTCCRFDFPYDNSYFRCEYPVGKQYIVGAFQSFRRVDAGIRIVRSECIVEHAFVEQFIRSNVCRVFVNYFKFAQLRRRREVRVY